MANYTCGTVSADYDTLEEMLGDPVANQSGNTGELVADVLAVANPANIADGFTLNGNGHIIDVSPLSSGACIGGVSSTGSVISKAKIVRIANTALTVCNSVKIDDCTINTPIQSAPIVGCTGDRNAVTTLDGVASGITGTDNVWVVNATGVTGAYTADDPALYFDGVDDHVETPNIVNDIPYCEYRWLLSSTASTVAVHARGLDAYRLVVLAGGELMVGSLAIGVYVSPNTVYTTRAYYNSNGDCTSLDIDGVEVWSGVSPKTTDTPTFYTGARYLYSLGLFLAGCVTCADVGGAFNYIQNGDFGSATLTDHSGNANDGTINGATWVLTTNYTPLIDGTLKLADGSYAGAVQPRKRRAINKMQFDFEFKLG